jgi:hypothetical protein
MANHEKNFKPFNTLSREDAQKIRSMGGHARASKIKERKTMRAMLEMLMEKEITNAKGEKATTQEAITVSLIKQALKGNVKAFEIIRDTMGEKPDAPIININQAVQVNKKDIDDAVNIINELR